MRPQADPAVRFLFVDDGSTDDTLNLLRELEKECGPKDNESEQGKLSMLIIHQENGGVSAARNAGLDASDAEYVGFFDIDDICVPDYIPTIKNIAARENGEDDFDVLIFNRVTFLSGDHTFPGRDDCSVREVSREEILKGVLFDPHRYGIGVIITLLRRGYVNETGLRFAEGYPYYEDGHFLYRALVGAERMIHLDRWLYGYIVKHEGSAMARFDGERLRCLKLFKELEGKFEIKAPGFAPVFRKYGVSRIYWSVLWQAALVSPSRKAFLKFARSTHADVYMRMLGGFPEGKVRILRRMFLISRNLYYLTVKLCGGRYSSLGKAADAQLDEAAKLCPDPGRVLVYGVTDHIGGRETYFMELFRNRKDFGFDFLSDLEDIVFRDELEEAGSKFYFVKPKGRHPVKHFCGIMRVLRAHPEYTVLYINAMDATSVYTALPAVFKRRRVVTHSHNNDCPYPGIHCLCRPLLNAVTSSRAACSYSAAEFMFAGKAGDALIVPNFINAKAFRFDERIREEKRREFKLGEKLTVCHVGRITLQKNPLFLADVFEEVKKIREDACFLHAGTGEAEDELKKHLKEKRLTDSFIMLGERDDVAGILNAADVFLFPSVYEGFGIALVEAQAAGLPCVVSDVIPEETGITDNVIRLSLDEPASKWAGAVVEAAGRIRKDRYDEIAASGYDISRSKDVYDRLAEMLLK